ncbi:hypothetical protein I6F40_09285 [Pseudoalteromonas sp. SWXJ133]|uniref:hypothetical protein n=1 Tax=Pseudoalteromonas sp. SWXJ133 TaxID=2792069 RepID=UPI0018CDAF04|nr:hypothetical protein [Pseudoalteromonas sp. SWXJ133]MBH0020532.1 hypothetical protein [Pseudoalteromonas sp. SWXJ133]
MKIPLFSLSLLSAICAFSSLTYTTPSHANTIQSTSHVGTWQNKDEDGDGVPDEQDDYPFDADKTTITVVQEQEFNNNVGQANPVGNIPFKAAGVISENVDIDDFKFVIPSSILFENLSVTFVLFKDDSRFTPSLTIINNYGDVISTIPTNIEHVGKVGQAITFSPKQAGEYNLSITDRNNLGADSFTYSVHAFIDIDKDGVPNNKEQALEMNYLGQHTDSDKVPDGNEYHIYTSNFNFSHDVDNDGVPNWHDLDSDDDGITDNIESTYDLDGDKKPAFIDLDSDNNAVLDSEELNLVEFIRYDLDGDGIPNFLDTDDDGDFLFDENDPQPLQKLIEISNLYPSNTPAISTATYSHSEQAVFINKVRPFFPANLNTVNLKGNVAHLVILKGDDKQPVVNLPVTITSDSKIEFVIRNYPKVALGGEPITFFLAIDGYKTNSIDATLLHPKTPIITDIPSRNVVEGDKALIIGGKLESGTSLVFADGPTIKLDYINDTNASFIVPSDVGTGWFSLQNVYGESNYSSIKKEQVISLKVVIPDYLNIKGPFYVDNLDGEFNDINAFNNTQVKISSTTEYISLYYKDGIRLFQSYITDDSQIELSVDSTLKSFVLRAFGYQNKVDDVPQLKNKISDLVSYKEFKYWYEENLRQDSLDVFLKDDSYSIIGKATVVADNLYKKLKSERKNNN